MLSVVPACAASRLPPVTLRTPFACPAHPQKRTWSDFEAHFEAAGLTDLVAYNKKKLYEVHCQVSGTGAVQDAPHGGQMAQARRWRLGAFSLKACEPSGSVL